MKLPVEAQRARLAELEVKRDAGAALDPAERAELDRLWQLEAFRLYNQRRRQLPDLPRRVARLRAQLAELLALAEREGIEV